MKRLKIQIILIFCLWGYSFIFGSQNFVRHCDPLLDQGLCDQFLKDTNSKSVEVMVNGWLTDADQKGFPFAQILYTDTSVEFNSKGQWGFGGVIYQGVETPMLTKVTGLKKDRKWDVLSQNNALIKLNKWGYFDSISLGRVFRNQYRNLLYQEWILHEKSQQEFEVTGGGDPQTGEWEGLAVARFKNLFFSFRDLEFSFERQQERQFWKAYYKEINPFGFPIWFDLSASSQRFDSTQISWAISSGLSYELNSQFELKWSTHLKKMGYYSLKDSISDYRLKEQALAIYKSLIRDRNDWALYIQGTWGVMTQNNRDYQQPKSLVGSKIQYNLGRTWFESEMNFYSMWLKNSEDYKEEWFKFGGAQSLRGHRENDVFSTKALQMKLQIGTPPGPMRVFIFWDKVNYLANGEQDWEKSQGWGLGLNLNSKTVELMTAYAWPSWTGTQNWSSGFLHFKLNQFF